MPNIFCMYQLIRKLKSIKQNVEYLNQSLNPLVFYSRENNNTIFILIKFE